MTGDQSSIGTDRFNYVANYECGRCGHERTKKMRVKIGRFDEECPECGEETTHGLTMEPISIDKFGEGLIDR